jgi:hypothetical protein
MQLPAYLEATLESFVGPDGRTAVIDRLRKPEDIMTAPRLAAMKSTRLSFAQLLARRMITERWTLERRWFTCDEEGDGRAFYVVQAGDFVLSYLVRCFRWDGVEKVGRRSDGARRDIMGAIFMGIPDEARIAREFVFLEKTEVDDMRTEADVTGWTPASRSARFFDHVVDSLVAGRQPDSRLLGSGSGYLLRNGGYLGSGRQGSASILGLPPDHPFRHPYFGDLFGLCLVRQVSIDLVNAIAAARNPRAAQLSPEIARNLGVGNSSGQGMCVALQRWPEWVSTWLTVRELALAYAASRPIDEASVARLTTLLERAIAYYRSIELPCEDYVLPPKVLARNLDDILMTLPESAGNWGNFADGVLGSFDAETAEQVNSLLIGLYPEFADAVAGYIPIGTNRDRDLVPEMTVGQLKRILRGRYGWALRCDMRHSRTRQHFWYHSIDNGEQRRGERIIDPHEEFESFIDHIGLMQRLSCVLASYEDDTIVAELLCDHPDLSYGVARAQYLADLPYAEIRDNLLHREFLPAHLIRFYLAVLGIECTSPLSIRYVRGVFFQGLPLPEEIASGVGDDWMFPLTQEPEAILEGSVA